MILFLLKFSVFRLDCQTVMTGAFFGVDVIARLDLNLSDPAAHGRDVQNLTNWYLQPKAR